MRAVDVQLIAALALGAGSLLSGLAAIIRATRTRQLVERKIAPKVEQLAERTPGVSTMAEDEADGAGPPR